MARWADFEALAPEMAAAGRALLYQFGPGLGFLATVRPDGGPRLHPMCPILCDGDLWAFILTASPKGHDLRRDGRVAIHSFPKPDTDDEFLVLGAAELAGADHELRQRVADATTASVGAPEEDLYRVDVERAQLAVYERRPQWPPAYTIWVEGRGITAR